jgi:hypothetical protein
MKHYGLYVITATLAAFASVAVASGESGTGRKVYTIAVSERADAASDSPVPSFSYFAIDGGFVEAGDPVGGETPPTPAEVASALRESLASQHHQPAVSPSVPAVVLIYHWGVIRPDSNAIKPASDIAPNLRARLSLVAPQKLVDRIATRLVTRRYTHLGDMFDYPDERDALENARDSRYFVTVSAYDYAALVRGEITLRWRTHLSAATNSGSMNEVVPALLRKDAESLGRHFEDAETHVWRFSRSPAEPSSGAVPEASDYLSSLNHDALQDILVRERAMAWGRNLNQVRKEMKVRASSARPAVPPELTTRIAEYKKQKSALQEALAARIKTREPGSETRQAIAAFDSEHAREMTELNRMRESIRDELAALSSRKNGEPNDRSLDALVREFAAGVHDLDGSAASANP